MVDLAMIPIVDPVDVGLVSSDRGSSTPSTKPRKKTMTSVYLKFFETASEGKSRRCKFCGQSYSIATATGNLGRHLSTRHPGYDKSGDVVTSPAPQPATVNRKPRPQSQSKASQMDYNHIIGCMKGELFPESLKSDNFLDEVRAHFISNCSTSHFPSMASGYSVEEGCNVSFAEETAQKKRRASMSSATDELTQYLSDPPAPLATDVLEWWKVNSMRYPRLSLMARDFLAVQAVSVAPEELFCGNGDEIYEQRFCMSHDSTQTLLCLRSWLQSGMKLQYKSSEIDFERLMELATSAAAADNSTHGSERIQKH